MATKQLLLMFLVFITYCCTKTIVTSKSNNSINNIELFSDNYKINIPLEIIEKFVAKDFEKGKLDLETRKFYSSLINSKRLNLLQNKMIEGSDTFKIIIDTYDFQIFNSGNVSIYNIKSGKFIKKYKLKNTNNELKILTNKEMIYRNIYSFK